MGKTLITSEKLKELGFTPLGHFYVREDEDVFGSITYTESITSNFELGENSLDVERCYCVKLYNNQRQEVRFFTEVLYVEDITTIIELMKNIKL